MTKWHLSSSNKPAVCKADKRACPRGHYESLPEAQVAAVRQSLPVDLPEIDLLAEQAGRVGVDPNTLRDHTGRSLTEYWRQVFDIPAADRNLQTAEDVIRDIMPLDMGRERGLWVEWQDPEVPIDPDDDHYNMDGSTTDDEQLALGHRPVIVVHTRNGAGNRECYCEDEQNHERGCLYVINQAMTEHPLYISDHDDSYDYTYANFYFNVPVDRFDELQSAFHNAKRADRVKYAENLKQLMNHGEVQPENLWALFPENPVLRDRMRDLYSEASRLRQDTQTQQGNLSRGIYGIPGGYLNPQQGGNAAQRAQLKAVLEQTLAGNLVTSAERLQAGFRTRPAPGSKHATWQDRSYGFEALHENQQKLAEATVAASERQDLVTRLRALSPELAAEAERHMTSLEANDKVQQDLRDRVTKAEEPMRKALKALEAIEKNALLEAQVKAEEKLLRSHLHYPGTVDQLKRLLTTQ